MAQVTLPVTLTAGQPENVADLNSNLNALVNGVNTIDTAQLSTSRPVTMGTLANDALDTLPPVGSLMDWAGLNDPDPVGGVIKWVKADGRELAIATYGTLYGIVGTAYGSLTNGAGAAGSTHFRVPDFGGRVAVAPDAARAAGSSARMSTSNTRGTGAGSESVTLATGNIPQFTPTGSISSGTHTHTGTVDSAGNHSHTPSASGTTFLAQYTSGGYNFYTGNGTGYPSSASLGTYQNTNTTGSHQHTFTSDGATYSVAPTFTGNPIGNVSPTAIDNRQPYLVVNKIIRVA